MRCGSPALTCQTGECASANLNYRACTDTGGNVTYDYGGLSCTCPSGNATQCQSCVENVATFCEGGGGVGGSGGGGSTCTTTFSGAFTATDSSCAVTLTYISSADVWTVATAGNAIPGTSYTWGGMSFLLGGTPATGTYDQAASMGASDQVTETGNSSGPVWEAGFGSGMVFGTATLTITSLGSSSLAEGGSTLYQAPHGTWTGTLIDQTGQQPAVMQTITF